MNPAQIPQNEQAPNQYLTFVKSSIEDEVEIFSIFLDRDNLDSPDSRFIFEFHPELESAIKDNPETSFDEILRRYLTSYYSANEQQIEQSFGDNIEDWNKYGVQMVTELKSLMGLKSSNRILQAYLSCLPISPRFLSLNRFNVFYRANQNGRRELVAEEVLHFLYFEKWAEVFPEDDSSDYEIPHPIWQLSEMMVPVILGDEKIASILGSKTELSPYYGEAYPDWKDKIVVIQKLYERM